MINEEKNDDESDEFLDEDIDDRAEEKADQNDKKVQWCRLFNYFFQVLKLRLGLAMGGSRKYEYKSSNMNTSIKQSVLTIDIPLLPVPLARSRLLETLGAVTMCCFVDDDIICEGYSVTEEIFLLKGDIGISDSLSKNVSTNIASQSHDDGTKESTKEILSTAASTTSPAKSIVLDLHANPEASGMYIYLCLYIYVNIHIYKYIYIYEYIYIQVVDLRTRYGGNVFPP
jgi:hypothetical protein